jgi:hypothetical protein
MNKNRWIRLYACSLLVANLTSAIGSAASLRAGIAKADITPPLGILMWGYGGRKSPATGTLDPLEARVLVLDDGHARIALVAVDLGRAFGPSSQAHLEEAARRSSAVSAVLVAASHTHSGPVIMDSYAEGPPAWESAAIDKILKAIDQAASSLVDARIGVGRGSCFIGYNRLVVGPNGKVKWLGSNPTEIPTSPVDPTVTVVRLDRADGTPLAILVNYACHPVVFGGDNLQYSADYPAVMRRTVEETVDGHPLCLFLQGAPGDINPYHATTPLPEDAVRWRDLTGQQLGEEASRVAKRIATQPEATGTLDYAEDYLQFRLRWDPEKFRQELIHIFGPSSFEVFAPRIEPEFKLPVSTLLINKRIALMTMPGEPFVDFQIDWRNRCPAPDRLFLGYTNGYYGYFPTIAAAARGGYGASGATTWLQVGAGEQMVNHALVRVYEMLGQLGSAPEQVQF